MTPVPISASPGYPCGFTYPLTSTKDGAWMGWDGAWIRMDGDRIGMGWAMNRIGLGWMGIELGWDGAWIR